MAAPAQELELCVLQARFQAEVLQLCDTVAALVRARGEASCREAEQLRAAVTRHALLAYTLCIRGQQPFYFFYKLIYNLHIVITLYV